MNSLAEYFKKFKGSKNPAKVPPRPKPLIMLSSFIGAFLGIASVVGISLHTVLIDEVGAPAVMGSIGAIAVLIYGAIEAPLSQPRNLIFGNLLSALVGIILQLIFQAATQSSTSLVWLKAGLSVSISLVLMQFTRTVHPPAGATALIAVTGGQRIYSLGFLYLVIPVILSISVMLIIALLVNNATRQYPQYWFNSYTNFREELRSLTDIIGLKNNEVHVEQVDEKKIESQPEPVEDIVEELKIELKAAKLKIQELEAKLQNSNQSHSSISTYELSL